MKNKTETTSIGDIIKNFRTWRGTTQQDLADALGMSKSVISNWERNTNSPDIQSCMKICNLLNVSLNELVGWDTNEEYEKYIEDQKAYEEDLEGLRKKAAKINEQIKEIEQKKEQKVPRPREDQWSLLPNIDEELPYN